MSVIDEDNKIREMPQALRERVHAYEEQRRERALVAHQLAHPEKVVTTPEERLLVRLDGLHRMLFMLGILVFTLVVIAFSILMAVIAQ